MKRLTNRDKSEDVVNNGRIAVFAGSFDPVTAGHEDLVRRSVHLFDKIIVAIGENTAKKCMFPLEKRLTWLRQTFASYPQVEIDSFQGLTVDYCKSKGAKFLLRGVRNGIDFEYEKNIAQINRELDNGIETVLMFPSDDKSFVSSSFIREMLTFGKNIDVYLPSNVQINP